MRCPRLSPFISILMAMLAAAISAVASAATNASADVAAGAGQVSHSATTSGGEIPRHATAVAVPGEKPLDLLRRYQLDRRHLRGFLVLNRECKPGQPLAGGASYRLPAHVFAYNGQSIRTTLEVPLDHAVAIREYSAALAAEGLKPAIADDREIWVPYDQVVALARHGQRVIDLLTSFGLSDRYVTTFGLLNDLGEVNGGSELEPGRLYRLPVHIRRYDGPTISEALGVTYHDALRIRAYNDRIHASGLKRRPWTDHLLWVPYELADNPLYGPVYRIFEKTSDQLRHCVFHLSPGHGGPDPGTLGDREGRRICEDEYTLDITLRLARELESRSARVEVVIRDEGIRDEKFLPCDEDELFLDGKPPVRERNRRLRQRVTLVNSRYARLGGAREFQRFVSIHIDFRPDQQKHVDFDVYHHCASGAGRRLAGILQETIVQNLTTRLAGRPFQGRVKCCPSNCDYYVLRQTRPPAVLIELANINNDLDQLRFIVIDSRQRIAEWLCEGLVADWERTSEQDR